MVDSPTLRQRSVSAVGRCRRGSSAEEFNPSAVDVAEEEGWIYTKTKDDARDKAVSSHETMGLVSALLAGFELGALVEVNICTELEQCTGFESAFVVTATLCVGLSMLVVLETAFEYMFVMRELHHGRESAWNLIAVFAPFRRAAEVTFALEIFFFLLSTGFMVHVRFARALTGGTYIAHFVLGVMFVLIIILVTLMQRAKVHHGEGKKIKRREADERRRARREVAATRKALTSAGRSERERPDGGAGRRPSLSSAQRCGSIKSMLAGLPGGARRGSLPATAERSSGRAMNLSPVPSVNAVSSRSAKAPSPTGDSGAGSSSVPASVEVPGGDDLLANAVDHSRLSQSHQLLSASQRKATSEVLGASANPPSPSAAAI